MYSMLPYINYIRTVLWSGNTFLSDSNPDPIIPVLNKMDEFVLQCFFNASNHLHLKEFDYVYGDILKR